MSCAVSCGLSCRVSCGVSRGLSRTRIPGTRGLRVSGGAAGPRRVRAPRGLRADGGRGLRLPPAPRGTHTGQGAPFSPTWRPEPLAPGSQPPPSCKSFAFTIPPLAHYHTNFICLGLVVAIKLARFPGLACPGCEEEEVGGDPAPASRAGRWAGRCAAEPRGCSAQWGWDLDFPGSAALESGWSRAGSGGRWAILGWGMRKKWGPSSSHSVPLEDPQTFCSAPLGSYRDIYIPLNQGVEVLVGSLLPGIPPLGAFGPRSSAGGAPRICLV